MDGINEMRIIEKKDKFSGFKDAEQIKNWNDPNWHNHALFKVEMPFKVGEEEYIWKVNVWSRFLTIILLAKLGQVYYVVGEFHFNGQIDWTRKKMFEFIKGNKLLMPDLWKLYKIEYKKYVKK